MLGFPTLTLTPVREFLLEMYGTIFLDTVQFSFEGGSVDGKLAPFWLAASRQDEQNPVHLPLVSHRWQRSTESSAPGAVLNTLSLDSARYKGVKHETT
jgi:hypothetical protein